MTRSPQSCPLSAPHQGKPSLTPDFIPNHSEPLCRRRGLPGRLRRGVQRRPIHHPPHNPQPRAGRPVTAHLTLRLLCTSAELRECRATMLAKLREGDEVVVTRLRRIGPPSSTCRNSCAPLASKVLTSSCWSRASILPPPAGVWCSLSRSKIGFRAVTWDFSGSGGVLVLVDQAAEDGCAADGVVGEVRDGRRMGLDIGWVLSA
jgi:hypothetical protein